MKKLFFLLLIVFVSFLIGYHILSIWRGTHLYQANLSKESLLKAIRLNPSNPDPFYRLGLFYQWDFHNIDLKESLKYLRKAIERNPLEQQYYLNLAKILYRLRRKECIRTGFRESHPGLSRRLSGKMGDWEPSPPAGGPRKSTSPFHLYSCALPKQK